MIEIILNNSKGEFISNAFIETEKGYLPTLVIWHNAYFTKAYLNKYQECKPVAAIEIETVVAELNKTQD